MSFKTFVFCNRKHSSIAAYENLINILKERGHEVLDEYSEDSDLLICIGGDGTFLSFTHKCGFPSAPILGINTGHLGFFQESSTYDLETTISDIENGKYKLQNIKPVRARIVTRDREFIRVGINEIVVRGTYSHSSHYSVYKNTGFLGRRNTRCYCSRIYSIQLFARRFFGISGSRCASAYTYRSYEHQRIQEL